MLSLAAKKTLELNWMSLLHDQSVKTELILHVLVQFNGVKTVLTSCQTVVQS